MADVKNLEELAHPDYWDQRYRRSAADELFEWFKPFKSIEPLLTAHLPKPTQGDGEEQPRILHLGCGNSVCEFSVPYSLHIYIHPMIENINPIIRNTPRITD